MLETTELRWFATAPLPDALRRWFLGTTAAIEERCDRYLLDGRVDVGVKLRNGTTLELKARLETAPPLDLVGGLVGTPEVWRKWTLAEGLVVCDEAHRWIDVDKWIAKRSFSFDGEAVPCAPRHDRRPSCDVEIVAVRVASRNAWSLAFAARGPRSSRPAAIRAAWRGLLAAGAPTFSDGHLDAERGMGYPEWLARCAASASADVPVGPAARRPDICRYNHFTPPAVKPTHITRAP